MGGLARGRDGMPLSGDRMGERERNFSSAFDTL